MGLQFQTHNQVFAREALPGVLCSLMEARDAGRPVTTSVALKVLPNAWRGIRGGTDVELLVVYNEACQDFLRGLPRETQEVLPDRRALRKDLAKFPLYSTRRALRKDLAKFPHFATFMQNGFHATALKASQVNLLAAHSEFVARANAQELKRLFDGGSAAGAAEQRRLSADPGQLLGTLAK